VIASKEIGLEVNAEKTKYMVMSRNQNVGHNHNIKMDNKSFERVEEFKYLGATLTNRNSTHEEIKSRLKSGNACYHSVQNLLSSRLLSKNTKIRVELNDLYSSPNIIRVIKSRRMRCAGHVARMGEKTGA
jgi:hypothetical protein